MSKKKGKKRELTDRELDMIDIIERMQILVERQNEIIDLLKIISAQTRHSEVITVRQHDDPELQRRKVSAAQEIEAVRAEEAERYHAYRDKPLQPYVRVHEAP
ncbi:hypothetical protein Jasper_39 [Mycobacterium phage Jasper]|uniref:Uncharacterized protein n=2 Tax=Fromanvirus jasper TaxID=540065 RepID=B3VGS7_9CAUD|nr:hypothetical protein Jasper_39 [Mycobacterium phage Jasper]YP_009014028.1 hypothetical protein CL62_gp39 [Mycobacterium phage Dreamboat]ACE80054.1 hypothetical protein Jasper_39 [Mycobacterium phage Jasper]AEO94332.1 hypothetical protein DREAMBOAT_39 [Mycobacterium phage Dreamboat]